MFFYSESVSEDAETEVALNLICDETTRKTIDIPIRPRPAKDLFTDIQRKRNVPSDIEIKSKNSTRSERKDSRAGTYC